jgi:two-component system phosphate regulon sensor histidine kinase PhoR
MNRKKHQWILYTIPVVILITIGVQIFWNYKNYLVNKQQLVNDVRSSLDNAIESYYANLAKKTTMAYVIENDANQNLGSIFNRIKKSSFNGSLNSHIKKDVQIYYGATSDSISDTINKYTSGWHQKFFNWHKNKGNNKGIEIDTTFNLHRFSNLTANIIVSMNQEHIPLKPIDSLLQKNLRLMNLNVSYGMALERQNFGIVSAPPKSIDKLYPENITNSSLNVSSNSYYIPKGNTLILYFNNITLTVLKRSLGGILISTLLVLVVIGCLLYLLHIIKHQKQLAEVKNDLISNITHEFKTPIATIGVALESIKDFNAINNKEKTSSYLDMSKTQLDKLNVMVEKLLETATLDSEELNLNKENINIVDLVETLVKKYSLSTTKNLLFESTNDEIYGTVDIFHFENALNNVIDNAVKYGGEEINVKINQRANNFNLEISDNGNNLSPIHKQRIFEKFYRIPKGNTHDVKGFGIGLYYTKKIIEKHKGSVLLDLSNNLTTFKIFIPNE